VSRAEPGAVEEISVDLLCPPKQNFLREILRSVPAVARSVILVHGCHSESNTGSPRALVTDDA
jgi:hypothetical protein